MHAPRARSFLFTLRFWPEQTTPGHIEWRGKLQQASSGETIYFRDWTALLVFLQAALGSYADLEGQAVDPGLWSAPPEQATQDEPTRQGRDDHDANA